MTTIHQLHVGPGGTFEEAGDHHTIPAQVDALFERLKTVDDTALTIHFHGGLVSEDSGMRTAQMMRPVYEAADSYALSVIWETGLLETLRDNLTRIHQTELFGKLLKWVIKRAAERFGGFNARGAGVPIPDSEIEGELAKARPFESYDSESTGQGAARGGDIAVGEADLDDIRKELIAEFEEIVEEDDEIEGLLIAENQERVDAAQRGIFTAAKVATKLAKITYRVIRRHVRDRDHGFYPSVVEEILREYYLADLGSWVWGQMKDKAQAMWQPNDGLIGEEQHAGAYMLEAISKLQLERNDFQVNLVGHSAGSIAICHLLAAAAARHPGLKVNQVIFMAPAVRSDLAVGQLVNHPERFESFRNYTMADSFEREDSLVPFVYTRSLLYFISGVLEPDAVDQPIAGMMRHATRKGPFSTGVACDWADFLLANGRNVLSDSTVLDPDAPPGRRSTAHKHGDFDNDTATQESLTHVLKE